MGKKEWGSWERWVSRKVPGPLWPEEPLGWRSCCHRCSRSSCPARPRWHSLGATTSARGLRDTPRVCRAADPGGSSPPWPCAPLEPCLPAHAPIQGVHHDRSGVRHLPLYQRLPCLGGFLQPSHADGLLGAIISPVQVVPHPVHSDPFHIVDTFGEKQEHELGNSRKMRSGSDGPIK